ncbi:ABC transporter substrate-binding protein [Micromonospora cathayae]|uniref:ABC transporter substrate-binding protein n=1 Tax=Micromonospora cathayae TaxID=3028804 RepID=A0ABY7ZND1_9ACTN|nr:ABC transporter substrate-binding protein [Micromonospora sp. HUAS 3]WDZ84499.1 ABC transporter substrate-binding protein [Micromonospora sp. HUAS 3]
MKLTRTLTAAFAAVALALAGCSGGGQTTEASSSQLVLGNNGDVLTWDPAEMKEGAVIHYAEAVYDPLLRKTPDSTIEPNLATEYEYNADLTELTLKLRDGVTFSDDTAFDADAVRVNLEARKKGAGSASEAARVIERVEVVDKSTVKLHLSEPSPGLLAGLATYLGYMASPKALAAGGIATTPVGSGPYLLDAGNSEKGVRYTFTSREGYWNRDAFPFETVVIRPYEEFTARYNALTTGQIQFMYGTPDMVPKAKTDGLTVATVPGEWQGIILQDRAGKVSPALGDVRVRQAINHALDRKAILDTHYGGLGQVSTQTFNPASEAWVPSLNERYPYDPAKAKELLTAAGYPDGFTIKVSFSEGFMSPLVPIVAQYLGDVGITVEQVPVNGFANGGLETLKGQPAFMLSFSTNIPAWTDVLNKLTPTSLWNNFQYTDATVTRLLKEIPAAQGDQQAALYKELNTHLVEQAWFAPIVTQENVYLSKPEIDVTMQQAQLMPSLRFFAPAK